MRTGAAGPHAAARRRSPLTRPMATKSGPGEMNGGPAGLMDGKNLRGVIVHQHEE
jgi:hypothetical protein